MKFIEVTPENNYILRVKTDAANVYLFDVYQEVQRIPSYKCLMDKDFLNKLNLRMEESTGIWIVIFILTKYWHIVKKYDFFAMSGQDLFKIDPLR